MNTILCDWPDSEPADVLGPVILWWLESVSHTDFDRDAEYHDRVITDNDDTDWCLSEVLDGWLKNDRWIVGNEVHEGCPWQS